MPQYDFFCEKCHKEVSMTLSMSERDRREYRCPTCGGKELQPLMGTFFSKTSRKA
jgi:putative FmdB family regulatory protein